LVFSDQTIFNVFEKLYIIITSLVEVNWYSQPYRSICH